MYTSQQNYNFTLLNDNQQQDMTDNYIFVTAHLATVRTKIIVFYTFGQTFFLASFNQKF